jgi:Xaa-Pro aminopeptidase
MKEQKLDAILMFRQESMYWLTGYDTFGYVFFQTLILDQKGNVILLTRAPDLRQAQNTSNIENIKIASSFCSFIDFNVSNFLFCNSSLLKCNAIN